MFRKTCYVPLLFPAVVIPSKPWNLSNQRNQQQIQQQHQQQKSFSSSSSSSPPPSSISESEKQQQESQRVIDLGNRVRKILQQKDNDVAKTSSSNNYNNNVFESEINSASQILNQQQNEFDEAKSTLTGNNDDDDNFSHSSSTSAELAWAERILKEKSSEKQNQEEINFLKDSTFSAGNAKQEAMMEFLKMQSSTDNSSKNKTKKENGNKKFSKNGKLLLQKLRDGNSPMLTKEESNELVDYLDSFVLRNNNNNTHNASSDFPTNEINKSSSSSSSTSPQQQKIEMTDKERGFLLALEDVSKLMGKCGFKNGAQEESENVEWFLACGTALGCHREGRFIAHDNDIDIGVLYPTRTNLETNNSNKKTENEKEEFGSTHDKLLRLVTETSPSLINEDASSGSTQFICFEILGSIYYGGFQLRLLHLSTATMVDVNVYYESPVDSETGKVMNIPTTTTKNNNTDCKNKRKKAAIWFSTFYEDSKNRKHGMYRYQFSSPIRFVTKEFYGRIYNNVPDERYLEEYFGNDWKIPKKYSYEEGVSNRYYRNIVDE